MVLLGWGESARRAQAILGAKSRPSCLSLFEWQRVGFLADLANRFQKKRKELAACGVLLGQLAGLAIFADARAAVGPSGPLTGPIDMFLYALGHAAPPRPPE